MKNGWKEGRKEKWKEGKEGRMVRGREGGKDLTHVTENMGSEVSVINRSID